jgi:hypothetical protein
VLALLGLGLAAAADSADIEALMRAWTGAHDSSEAVTVSSASAPRSDDSRQRRIITLVAPLQLPWLGPHVLYLEEFPYDEPDALRRQRIVVLQPAGARVRARLFTFVQPRQWTHLDRRPGLAARLGAGDLRNIPACDLLFTRQGLQFQGATAGHGCLATPGDADPLYVDYQLMLDTSLYWYRRRLLRVNDGALQEEVDGFNWFELNEARLFTCRIDWSASGRSADLRPLVRLDLHDKGGRGELATPDGGRYLLTLHSQDWPFAAEHGSLVLLLTQPGAGTPLAAAWAVVDDAQISMRLGWLRVRCGAVEPRADEVRG